MQPVLCCLVKRGEVSDVCLRSRRNFWLTFSVLLWQLVFVSSSQMSFQSPCTVTFFPLDNTWCACRSMFMLAIVAECDSIFPCDKMEMLPIFRHSSFGDVLYNSGEWGRQWRQWWRQWRQWRQWWRQWRQWRQWRRCFQFGKPVRNDWPEPCPYQTENLKAV